MTFSEHLRSFSLAMFGIFCMGFYDFGSFMIRAMGSERHVVDSRLLVENLELHLLRQLFLCRQDTLRYYTTSATALLCSFLFC